MGSFWSWRCVVVTGPDLRTCTRPACVAPLRPGQDVTSLAGATERRVRAESRSRRAFQAKAGQRVRRVIQLLMAERKLQMNTLLAGIDEPGANRPIETVDLQFQRSARGCDQWSNEQRCPWRHPGDAA